MARPIPYDSNLTASSVGTPKRQMLRGLIIGLIVSILISAGVWALSVGIEYRLGNDGTAVADFCKWLYESEIGTGIRESIWVFPIIEGTHLLGIALSVGLLCWFDLRLLGLVLRDEPVSKVWKQVMPTAFIGFALMFITGLFLFWAEASTAYHSAHFWIKLVLLAAAGANALSFETTMHKNMAEWDLAPVPPLRARMTGAISLILWTAIIVTGRTMAYSF
jgi:hypothetical protein